MDDNGTSPVVQQNPEDFFDVAGCPVAIDPFAKRGSKKTRDEYDKDMLAKLWWTGLDVDTLDEAHFKYHISPVRDTGDCCRVLGYQRNRLFKDEHLTALVLQQPNLQKPGEVFTFNEAIRMRPRTYVTHGNGEKAKYEQPKAREGLNTRQLYFMIQREVWDRLYDVSQPLIITEGEFKAIALALAGYAAVGIQGCTLWRAADKKDVIHWSLDPKNPWAIPIVGRQIILIPDVDFFTKPDVCREFRLFARKLHLAGASVKLSFMPYPRNSEWKGIDDYITYYAHPRWARDSSKVGQANKLVMDIIEGGECEIIRDDSIYVPVDTMRCRNRVLEQLKVPSRYTVVGMLDGKEVSWFVYSLGASRYLKEDICFTTTNTSGKMARPSAGLRKLVEDDYELGIKLYGEEGHVLPKGGFKSMPIDHPNSVLAKVDTQLPRVDNECLMEPFPGVDEGDICLRIRGALVNLTKAFALRLDWERRKEWLVPPDYRWFSMSALDVSLSNLGKEPACPLFMEFLDNAFEGDIEKIECLQLWFGKIVTSPLLHDLQQFLCLYGAAGSGKSTIEELLITMIGASEVVNIRGDFSSRFELSDTPGKKLIVFSETQDGDNKGLPQSLTNAIKSITGGDYTTVESKGRTPISLKLKAEIMLVSNNIIEMKMETEAFKRRVVFLSTTKKIDNPSRDKRQEMFGELPGIFLWALKGAMLLYRDGEARIETPSACAADLEEASSNVDPERTFIRTRIEKVDKDRKDFDKIILRPTDLAEAFSEWLIETGRRNYDAKPQRLSRLVREIHSVQAEVMVDPNEKGSKMRAFKGLRLVDRFGTGV